MIDERYNIPLLGYFCWKEDDIAGVKFSRLCLGSICLATVYKYENKYYFYTKTGTGDSAHSCSGDKFEYAEIDVFDALGLHDRRDDGK